MNRELNLRIMEMAVKMVQLPGSKDTDQVLSEAEKNYKRIVKLVMGEDNK